MSTAKAEFATQQAAKEAAQAAEQAKEAANEAGKIAEAAAKAASDPSASKDLKKAADSAKKAAAQAEEAAGDAKQCLLNGDVNGAVRAAYKAKKAAETAQKVVGKTQKSVEANTARLRPSKSAEGLAEKPISAEGTKILKEVSEYADLAIGFAKEAESSAKLGTAGKQEKLDAAAAKRAADQAEKAATQVKDYIRKGNLSEAKRAAYVVKRASDSAKEAARRAKGAKSGTTPNRPGAPGTRTR